MECPRGKTCIERNHEVYSLKAAQEWFAGVVESDLPVSVNQLEGAGGRLRVTVYSTAGNLLAIRG